MRLTFTDGRGTDRSFPVPQEFEALLKTQAVEHDLSTQQALLLGVASGRIIVEEPRKTTTDPKDMAEGLRGALEVLFSPEGQRAIMRIVCANSNDGPTVGIIPDTPGGYHFSWKDGRSFEGVLEKSGSDEPSYVDKDGNRLTLDEILRGTSPHIKKSDLVDFGIPEQKPPYFL